MKKSITAVLLLLMFMTVICPCTLADNKGIASTQAQTQSHFLSLCAAGDIGTIEHDYSQGMDINFQVSNKDYGWDSETPLGIAAQYKRADVIAFLKQKGADCEIKSHGKFPMEIFFESVGKDPRGIEFYKASCIAEMLRHCGPISNEQLCNGLVALMYYCGEKYVPGQSYNPLTVWGQDFITEQANYDPVINGISTTNGMTPLTAAAKKGDTYEIAYLIRNGANPNKIDGNGRTPLSIAADANTVDALKRHGATKYGKVSCRPDLLACNKPLLAMGGTPESEANAKYSYWFNDVLEEDIKQKLFIENLGASIDEYTSWIADCLPDARPNDVPVLWIDGHWVNCTPVIKNRTTYLPLRPIVDAFPYRYAGVNWIPSSKSIVLYEIDNGDKQVFRVNNRQVMKYYKGKSYPYTMTDTPLIINGQAMIPLRALGDCWCMDVNWDARTRLITMLTREECN